MMIGNGGRSGAVEKGAAGGERGTGTGSEGMDQAGRIGREGKGAMQQRAGARGENGMTGKADGRCTEVQQTASVRVVRGVAAGGAAGVAVGAGLLKLGGSMTLCPGIHS